MRYRDLKDERDAAVARALEAERLSMRSEFDRVTAEFENEKVRLIAAQTEAARVAFRNGFNVGLDAMADDIADRLKHRTGLVPPSLKSPAATTGSRVVPGARFVPAEVVGGFTPEPPTDRDRRIVARESVRWFAEQMEFELRKNDHKGGWGRCTNEYLCRRIDEESTELRAAIGDRKRGVDSTEQFALVVSEAADVANFAMMLADNARRQPHYGTESTVDLPKSEPAVDPMREEFEQAKEALVERGFDVEDALSGVIHTLAIERNAALAQCSQPEARRGGEAPSFIERLAKALGWDDPATVTEDDLIADTIDVYANSEWLNEVREELWTDENRAKPGDVPDLVRSLLGKVAGEAGRVEAARREGWRLGQGVSSEQASNFVRERTNLAPEHVGDVRRVCITPYELPTNGATDPGRLRGDVVE